VLDHSCFSASVIRAAVRSVRARLSRGLGVTFPLSNETCQVNDRLGIGHEIILLNVTTEVFCSSPYITNGILG
jgi:hypothetical protein